MFATAVKKVFGSRNQRLLKDMDKTARSINDLEPGVAALSDAELSSKTQEFRQRFADGESDQALLPESFAVVREVAKRTLNMRHFDVQLVGGMVLHQGKIAEMRTGEGKTLVATLPVYLNVICGKTVHVVTVNDYLASRDADWMGRVYRFLGLTTGVIVPNLTDEERRAAYAADITYGTNNEFGFDYLRDNMVHKLEQRVQREHAYAIIDEVDSILIDEARTPLIISGPVGRDTSTPFKQYNQLISSLYKKQLRITNDLVSGAQKHLAAEEQFEAGEKLLAVKRGTPRHRKFMKLMADDPSLQTLVNKVEADYMREKRLHEIDELLYFAMDEKGHNVHLSDRGLDELSPNDPEAFTVPDLSAVIGEIEASETLSTDDKREQIQGFEAEYAAKSQKIHVIHQLLKAYTLFHKDEKYIIGENGEVVIVDEFTGRQMAGRRWSDGLHQAVEAKEGVEIRGETQTLATVTIQNYFRMFDKLAGMTGTAETEETEFHQIYGLDVLVIPTNRPVVRDDRNDLIFRTKREKYNALMDEIQRLNKMDLPVLVGTTNVDISETFSRMLKRRGVPHQVLNAKHHKSESDVVRDAGQPGAVTIATNMAGRGTDIKLGSGITEARTIGWLTEHGTELEEAIPVDPVRAEQMKLDKVFKDAEKNGVSVSEMIRRGWADDDVLEDGGLQILGSERHDSRRIDRQLRGRSGRQGDPGTSQFYLSLEDDLFRLFGGERIAGVMDKMGAGEGEVITHGLVTKSIERAQRKVEINNFEARKRLLDYDDVMNQQREVIYDLRLFALEGGEDLKGEIWEMIEHATHDLIDEYASPEEPEESWDLAGLRRRILLDSFVMVKELPEENDPELEHESHEIEQWVTGALRESFLKKVESLGEHQEQVSGFIMLSVIDDKWKDHLYDLDHLKTSISFRGWGQKDPLVEYKKEAYEMFVDLMADIQKTVSNYFFRAQFGPPQPKRRVPQRLAYSGPSDSPGTRAAQQARREPVPAGVGGRDELGMSSRASVGGGASAGAPDPRRLATNRGEQEARKPIKVDKQPGRNDPCPCGSGKKYKKCHGR